ncbi:MAG TPA: hypothetical protein VFO54_11165 [Chryseosolibacter sp.]|nr:hypothetical protein [Chryseosolibacter sp.]
MKIVFIAILLACGHIGFAQRNSWPSDLWHEGKVVLLAGDTLKGLIKYDFQLNTVQFVLNDQEKAEIYHARKVLFVEIFDETAHRYRKFFALPYSNPSNYKAPVFFELLVEGKITLLSREFLEYKTYSSSFYGGSYTRQVQTYYYYLMKDDGTIEDFSGNKNDLLSLMGKRGKDVEKYVKANRLDFDDKYDLVKIVAYYNSLMGT